MKTNTDRVAHALNGITIPDSATRWEDRVSEWYRPMGFDERVDWLRRNIAVTDTSGDNEKCIFYLEVADHYGVKEHFRALLDHNRSRITLSGYKTLAEQKWLLANAAFKALCNKVFTKGEVSFPYGLQFTQPFLPKLLWFFRPYFYKGPDGFDNLRPYNCEGLGSDGGKHYLAKAEGFAREFVMDLWQIANGYWYRFSTNSARPKQINALPHLKEIVFLMNRLNLLESFRSGQCVPSPTIFRILVGIAGLMMPNGKYVDYQGGIMDSNAVLEPLAREGNKLAEVLLIARLHVEVEDGKRQKAFPKVLLTE